jgi:hypothetical protein
MSFDLFQAFELRIKFLMPWKKYSYLKQKRSATDEQTGY